MVDLYELFSDRISDYDYRDWDFENDRHWAEAANSLAASILYRNIARQTGLNPISEHWIDQALLTYYSAFDYGWMPPRPNAYHSPSQAEMDAISKKYSLLELEIDSPLDPTLKKVNRSSTSW